MAGREYVSRFDWKISPEEQRRRDEIAQGIVQDELSAAQDVGDTRSAGFLQQELSNRFKSGRVASPQSSTVESTGAPFSVPEDTGGWKTIDPGWTRKSAPSDDGWTDVSDRYSYVGERTAPAGPDESFMGSAGRGIKKTIPELQQAGAGVVAYFGDVFGADGLKEWGLDKYQKIDAETKSLQSDSDSFSKTFLDGEGSKTAWLGNAVGYTLGQVATALVSGGVGGIAGRVVAKKAIAHELESVIGSQLEKNLASGMAEAAAKAAAQKAGQEFAAGAIIKGMNTGAFTGAFAHNEALELGSIYNDAIEQAKKEGRTLDNGDLFRIGASSLAAAGVDTAMEAVNFNKLTKGGAGSTIAKRAAVEVPSGMTRESVTEAIQTGIEQYGAGKPLDSREIIDSAALGAVGGGMAGGGASLHAKQPTASTVPLDQAADAPITPVISPQEIAAITPTTPVLSARETRQQAVSEQIDNLPPQREASNREARQQAVADAVTPLPDQRTGAPTPVTQPFTDAQIAASEQAIRARQLADYERIAQAEQQNSVASARTAQAMPAPMATQAQGSVALSPAQTQDIVAPAPVAAQQNAALPSNITLSASGAPFSSLKAAQTSIKARGLKNAVAVSVQGGFGIQQGATNATNVPAEPSMQLAGRDSLPAGNQPNNGSGSERLPSGGNVGQVPGQPESVAGTRAAYPVYADQSGEALAPLKEEIGWAIRGGQMQRIPGSDGTVNSETITRSKWTPKSDFWPGRPKQGGALNETQAAAAIDKAIAGQPLNAAERRFVEYAKRFAADRETLSPNAPEQTEKTNKTDINEAEYEHYVQTGEPGFGWMPVAEAIQDASIEQLDALLELPPNPDERAGMRALGFTDEEITATLGPDTAASTDGNPVAQEKPGSNPQDDRSREAAAAKPEVGYSVENLSPDGFDVHKNGNKVASVTKRKHGQSFQYTVTPDNGLKKTVTSEADVYAHLDDVAKQDNAPPATPLEAAAKALESAANALRASIPQQDKKPATVAAVANDKTVVGNTTGRSADDVNSGATASSQMLDAIALDPSADYALRVIPGEFTGPVRIGDTLPASNRWEDGIDTGEPLRGTSGIGIEQRSLKGVEQAIHRIGSSKTAGPNGFYFGDRVVLIKGEGIGSGEDVGEHIIKDAEVVGIWIKQNDGKSEIQPNEPTASQNRDARPSLDLTSQTESQIKADEAKKSRDAAEKSAKDNAPSPEGFTLTGSNRAADVGEAAGQSAMFSRSEPAPLWRSTLTEAIGKAPFKETPAPQWKAWLQSNAAKLGVKKDEIEWSGITDWLDLQQGKVSREQVLDYLDANGVKVQEVVLGGSDPKVISSDQALDRLRDNLPVGWRHGDQVVQMHSPDSVVDDDSYYRELVDRGDAEWIDTGTNVGGEVTNTKYGTYTLPGGENYRELLLTLPEKKNAPVDAGKSAATMLFENDMMDKYGGQSFPSIYNKLSPSEIDKYEMYVREDWNAAKSESLAQDRRNNYKSSHWDQPNILAHIRFNERTDADGKRVLFIEEIQSDWGQAAKRNGIKSGDQPQKQVNPNERENLVSLMRMKMQGRLIAAGENANVARNIANATNPDLAARASGMKAEYEDLMRRELADSQAEYAAQRQVLNAPYVGKTEAWVSLALKRMIRYAVDNGFDRVAMVNGEQSAERYDLSKQISRVEYTDKGVLVATDTNGREALRQEVPEDKIEDYIGKEPARKLLAAPLVRDPGRGDINAKTRRIEGDGIKVGGEGMKAFYDKIVPQVANDVLKKLGGGKVGTVDVSVGIAPKNKPRGGIARTVLGNDSVADQVQPQPGFDITPAMKEQAAQGMPMFSRSAQLSTDEDGSPRIEGNGVTLDFANPTERLEFFPTDDNQQLYNFAIMGPDNAYLGYVEAVFDNGKPIALYDISIDNAKRKTGAATATVKALLDTSPNGKLAVMNIVPSAQGFWEKLGIGIQNVEQGAAYSDTITRESFAGSPAGKNRRGASGIERGSESASRGETSQEVGFTHADAVDLASKLSEAGLSGVTVVRTVADMPVTERDTVLSRVPDGKIRGAYFRDTDKVILVSSEIHSPKEALFVVSHEALHRGIANTLGNNAKPILKGMYDTNANLRKLTQQQMDRYGIGQEEAIEEALADMPVSQLKDLKGWDKLVDLIRSWLGKLANAAGIKIQWSDDMVATFVAGMRRNGLRDGVSVLEPDTVDAVASDKTVVGNTTGRPADDVNSGARPFDNDERANARAARASDVDEEYRLPNIHQAVPREYVPKEAKQSTVTIYRGVPATVENASIRPGDWVSLKKEYAQQHGTGESGRSKVISMTVPADHVAWAGTDMNEWFYAPRESNEPTTLQDGDVAFSRSGSGDLFDPKQTDAQSSYNGAEAVQGLGAGIKNILKSTANMARDRRGAALQFLGGRQIADIYTKDVPELPKYNERLQIMQAEQNEGSAVADAIIDKWRVLNRKRPEVALNLSALMHDATLAQFDPDTKKSELSVEFSDLRKRWVNLPQEGKDIYREARDAYATHFEKVKAELLDRVQRSALDTSAKQRTLDKMREEFTKSMKGVYFPLARFGDYMVIVKDSSGVTKSVNMAETTNQAQQMRAELIRAYPDDVVGAVQKKKEFNAERDGVSRGFMKDLVALINEEPDANVRESQLDAINQLWLSSLPDLSWAKSGIHRKGTPGYSNDAMRAFARNMFHGGYHLAKLRHGDRLADTLSQMQETIDSKIKADPNYSNVVAQSVVDEMNARHQHVMSPQNTPVANALTGLGFMWHMGLSPASAVVNLSQTALVAYPMLASKFGFTKAAKMLLSLSADAVKGKNNLLSQLKGKEREAYDRAVKEGLIDLTMAHDLAGVSQGKSGTFNENQQRVMRVASMMFHEAEKFNRGVTFMAAYRMATQAGVSDPYKLAHDLTYDSHFDYSATNRPRIMQGPTARVILLFKQYGQNMIYTLARNTAKSLQGDKEAMKTLGGLLAMHGIFAGALGLPLMTTLLAAASAIGGSEDEPWDAQVALRNYLAQTFGKDMGEVLAHGVFRAPGIKDAIGGDISGRVGLDSLLIRMPQETLEGKKYYQAFLEAIAGPVFGIGGNIANGMQTMSQGNTLRGIEEMLPKAIKDPLKAYRYDQEGIQDKTGITIVDETTIPEEVAQFLGFSAARGMEGFEGKSAIKNQETLLTQRRKQLMQRYTRDREEGDATDSQEAIQRWNRANPTMAIKGEDLMRSMREKARRQAEAENGVYLSKKRRGLAELGEFANVE